MAEKRDYNATMNAKGLEKSVTEQQARHMAQHQGSTYLFIVQAHSGPKVVNEDGTEKVNLIPDLVELVPEEHGERIRRFQRALYLARPDQFGQEAFETDPNAPGVDETGADIDAVVETDDKGEPVGIWDPTAELTEDAPLRAVPDPARGDADGPGDDAAADG